MTTFRPYPGDGRHIQITGRGTRNQAEAGTEDGNSCSARTPEFTPGVAGVIENCSTLSAIFTGFPPELVQSSFPVPEKAFAGTPQDAIPHIPGDLPHAERNVPSAEYHLPERDGIKAIARAREDMGGGIRERRVGLFKLT